MAMFAMISTYYFLENVNVHITAYTMNVFVVHSTELIFTPLCMEKRPEAKNDLYYSGLSGSKQGYSVT